MEERRGQGSATSGIKEMKENLGVGTGTGKGKLGASTGKGVGEEEASTEEVDGEAGVALTEVAGVAEEVAVEGEGSTGAEVDAEVLTGEEEGEGEVGEAGAGVEVEEATLARTGLALPVASVIGRGTGSASSVKHLNLRLVRMQTLHLWDKTMVVSLAQGTRRNLL